MHKVVRPFRFSEDGLTIVYLIAGSERDFGTLTAGLVADGFIEPVVVPAEPRKRK